MKRNTFSNSKLEIDKRRALKRRDETEERGRVHEILTYLCYALSPDDLCNGMVPRYQYCPNPYIEEMDGTFTLRHTPSIIDVAFFKEGVVKAIVDAKDWKYLIQRDVVGFLNQLDIYSQGISEDPNLEKVLVFSRLTGADMGVLDEVLVEYYEETGRMVEYTDRLIGLEELLEESRERGVLRKIKYSINHLEGRGLKKYLNMLDYAIADFMMRTGDMMKSLENIGGELDMGLNCVIEFKGSYSIEPRVVKGQLRGR